MKRVFRFEFLALLALIAGAKFAPTLASGVIQSAYSLIENNGTPVARRQALNFTGGATASDAGGVTAVNVTGVGGTFGLYSVVQHVFNSCMTPASGANCDVIVTPTTAGDLLFIAAGAENTSGTTPVFSSATGDGTWVHPTSPGCYATITAIGITNTTDCGYILSATGGAVTISWAWTASALAISYVEVFELRKSTGAAFAFDTAAGITSASCNICTAPALTLTGTVDYIAQWTTPWNFVVAITGGDVSGYQSPIDMNAAGQYAVAGVLNATSGTPPAWIQLGAPHSLAMSGVAFK